MTQVLYDCVVVNFMTASGSLNVSGSLFCFCKQIINDIIQVRYNTPLLVKGRGIKLAWDGVRMKIGICDDEYRTRQQMYKEIENYYKRLDVSALTFASGQELLNAVDNDPAGYLCVFLDIEMDEMDGLEAARQLKKSHAHIPVILLTSHTEYAMSGYEVEAFRFLSKPLQREKLEEALKAVEKTKIYQKKIKIISDGGEIYLPYRDIYYIKSENVYLQVVLKDRSYLIRGKLKEQLQQLPQVLFSQVHRSYIVNLLHVRSYDGKQILLRGGTRIPVSNSRSREFKENMMHYLREQR